MKFSGKNGSFVDEVHEKSDAIMQDRLHSRRSESGAAAVFNSQLDSYLVPVDPSGGDCKAHNIMGPPEGVFQTIVADFHSSFEDSLE